MERESCPHTQTTPWFFFSFFLLLLHSRELSVLPFDLSGHLKTALREQRKLFSFFLFISSFLGKKQNPAPAKTLLPQRLIPGPGVSLQSTSPLTSTAVWDLEGSITRGHSCPHHWGMSVVFSFVRRLRCSTSVSTRLVLPSSWGCPVYENLPPPASFNFRKAVPHTHP